MDSHVVTVDLAQDWSNALDSENILVNSLNWTFEKSARSVEVECKETWITIILTFLTDSVA
jgi:hypothetical protein